MFRHKQYQRSWLSLGFETLELIYHTAVRNLRKSYHNAVLGLVMAIVQALLMLLVIYFTMSLFGLRRIAVRGDFMLYVMSGVFMFMTHVKAIGAVASADGPTSPMMMHAPMNPIISIMGAALGSLYQQTLAVSVILFVYHAAWNPISIDQPVGMLGMYLLSWFSGIGIGMIFFSAMPWQPQVVGIIKTLYQRANVIASGKMVVANNLAPNRRDWFDWNPLFHTIDQARGFIFLNYTPRFTSYEYAIYFALTCMMIGLMAEFFTRQYASASWNKRN
ncbi:ABC transporter permease [Tabrizicola sp.]|uniref:ABC transporter permease n=1 Tax=Tabrizicola sp. TaxID=2005166 RepID=UPI0025EB0FD3|nr:ABC transporter permease [Tabrizicola sp.]MBY0349986.1 ABC transporter permease [Tabrizicola sp.]MDK2773437.1 ABC transporter permease [Tabrizicola sp.]